MKAAYASPLLTQEPSARFSTRPSSVGGWGNASPLGSHSRTLVAPMPQAMKPTGTSSRRTSASPSGGMKLPI